MAAWLRLYTELLHDHKVQSLSCETFKFWINCLCLAGQNEGYLPDLKSVSFALHETEEKTLKVLQDLYEKGLLDKRSNRFIPHNWHKRQYKSDTSNERVKRFRERKRNVTTTLPVTPSETDTEQIQNRTDTETDLYVPHGEFGHCRLKPEEFGKLQVKLGSFLPSYIDRFDRWLEENPLKRKSRKAYPSILTWFDKDGSPAGIKSNGNGNHSKPQQETEAEYNAKLEKGRQWARENAPGLLRKEFKS